MSFRPKFALYSKSGKGCRGLFCPGVSDLSQSPGRKMEGTLKGIIEEGLLKGLFIVKVKVKGTNMGW